MTQQARDLRINLEDRTDGVKVLIRDQGAEFTEAFVAAGTGISKTPVRVPWANVIVERRISSARRECPDWMLITSERHLRLVLVEYAGHYNSHRPHLAVQQGLPAARPDPPARRLMSESCVAKRAREPLLTAAGRISPRRQRPPDSEPEPVRDVADFRSVRRKPAIAGTDQRISPRRVAPAQTT